MVAQLDINSCLTMEQESSVLPQGAQAVTVAVTSMVTSRTPGNSNTKRGDCLN